MRTLILGSLMVISGLLLAACPIPNNYTTQSAFPQANFDAMDGMQWVPGDPSHAVVLTKGGVAWRINTSDPNEQATIFLDLSDRLIPNPGGEEGLLGLAFSPDYETSGRLYVHYTAEGGEPTTEGRSRQSIIARFYGNASAANPASQVIILKQPQPYANHNGGALAFGPDGYLYIAFGDGGAGGDPHGNGQRLDTLLGKILRIDVSPATGYDVPNDNPFVNDASARGEIWAYGFRNPWRITFDRETGALWTGDVGQNLWEEVDVVMKGGNYGWNELEGTHCYEPASCSGGQTVQPVAEYSHEFGCSVTGGYVYRGSAMPELVGWYIYGDFCSGRVWAVNTDDGPKRPTPIADTGKGIASFAEDPAGELYLVTFNSSIKALLRK